VDKKAPVAPLIARRHTPSYMRERGGASPSLLAKHVAIVGAGAVGSVVVDTLAAAGVGQLTVVDHDEYTEDNVFRHILEPLYIDMEKPDALKFALERRYPGLRITPACKTGQEWLKTADLSKYDGIVLALGAPSVERSFSGALKGTQFDLPVVFTWLEALDLGGHSALVWTRGEGCLNCAYRDDEGQASLASRTAFLEPNQRVTRNLTGCAGAFVPYGALQARYTGLMAAEHILSAVSAVADGDIARDASYRFWVGDGKVAAQHGLRTTPWFRAARATSFEGATRMVFGRPCGRCRPSCAPAS
jgi:threonine dehydrogenase-like Zn-dependent dehydrogenase